MNNFEPITSLIITRKTANYWVYAVNGESATRDANEYTGTGEGNYITIKTESGSPLVVQCPFSVVEYYDTTDAGNNLTNPQSREELIAHLLEQGFLKNFINGGGGGAGATSFKALTDVNIPSFAGLGGRFISIDENGIYLIAQEVINSIFGASDFLGTRLPNQYLVTSSQVDENGYSLGIVTASINNIVNRPGAFDEVDVIKKGYTWQDNTVVPNVELYSAEPGDLIAKWFLLPPDDSFLFGRMVYITGRWNGGDLSLVSSISNGGLRQYFSFDSDPDYEV